MPHFILNFPVPARAAARHRAPLTCVWIETGNPRRPLACRWIAAPESARAQSPEGLLPRHGMLCA